MPGFSEWCSKFWRQCICCGCCCKDEAQENLSLSHSINSGVPINNSFGSPSSRFLPRNESFPGLPHSASSRSFDSPSRVGSFAFSRNTSSRSFASPLSRRTPIDLDVLGRKRAKINDCLKKIMDINCFLRMQQHLLREENSTTRVAFVREFINPGNLEIISSSAGGIMKFQVNKISDSELNTLTDVACYNRVYSKLTSDVKQENVALCLMIFLPELVRYLKEQIISGFEVRVGDVSVETDPSQFTNILDLSYLDSQQIKLRVLFWPYGPPFPLDAPSISMTLKFNCSWTQLEKIS